MDAYSHALPVSRVAADERIDFIRLTYLHLTGAIFAFVLLTGGLLSTEIGVSIARGLLSVSWLLVLGLFIGIGWVAHAFARNESSPAMQYLGLGLYVVAESIIFLPLLAIAAFYRPDALLPAAVTTLVTFGGLTAFVFVSRKDFSFLGPFLTIAALVAFGAIACALIFGFSLGILFSAAMVALAAGYILYETSRVLTYYPTGSHVAASLALFASVALMFWYILQIFMSRR